MPPKPAAELKAGQQTLSSFFRPSQAQAPQKRPVAKARTREERPGVLVLDSSDEDDEAAARAVKRVKLEDGEGSGASTSAGGSNDAPTTSLSSSSSNTAAAPPAPASSSHARLRQFAYTPSTDANAEPGPSRELTAEERARKDAFAKRLSLATGRRTSGYLQKEHYLAAAAAGGSEEEGDGRGSGWEEEEEEEEEEGGSSSGAEGKGKGKGMGKGMGKAAQEEEGLGRFAQFAAAGTGKDKKGKGKAKDDGGLGGGAAKGVKYTPLEQQVLALKKANPGVLLVVEVGYKFRFFGEDAQHASRTLNIACFPSQHMLTASIPTHRLDIHVRRLLNAGYKVGVVRQQETAALKKAGDNRSAPFTRALTALYTSATYVDELGVDPLGSSSGATATLMCIVEDKPKGGMVDAKVRIGVVAVMPSTGEIVYGEFDDGLMRAELETRMLHLQPSELLLQKDLSARTESMVKHLAGQHNVGVGDFTTRIERITKRPTASQATSTVSSFYADAESAKSKGKGKGKAVQEQPSEIVLDSSDDSEAEDEPSAPASPKPLAPTSSPNPLDLPKLVLVALSSLISHLKSFALDRVFLHTSSFSPFASRASMTLNGNTVTNLEILRNSTDFKEAGSLIGVVDRCKSAMGKRMLRKWVTKPLVSIDGINARLSAIADIHSSSASLTLSKLRDLLRTLPDLERGLARIHFGRASPNEMLRVLEAFRRVGGVFDEVDSPGEEEEEDADGDAAMNGAAVEGDEDEEGPIRRRAGGSLKSKLLKSVVRELPRVRKTVEGLLAQIDVKAARDNKKESLFEDEGKYPDLLASKEELAENEEAMTEELKAARKLLRKPALQFTKVSQEEYLLEVKVAEAKTIVPADWVRINATKQVHRYRSPRLQRKLEKLEQAREKVAAAANAAFLAFLQEVASHYELFRPALNALSTADCLFSLSVVALSSNWTRPTIVDEPGKLEIVDGRHPIIEAVSPNPFVPNSVEFGAGKRHQMILTGLNMGGKSSLSRSIALIALLAQIGSYVPAESCTTSLFDGIYTRMGANDDLTRGRSTFMVELSETSEILRLATPRSLIILDELGRGTSTNDGVAIAEATLEHLVQEKKSTTVFVTHYPSLAGVAKRYPESVTCEHMACLETARSDGHGQDVTFLYKLAPGLASSSHGLNVARLADLPASVLETARKKAGEMEEVMKARRAVRRGEKLAEVLRRVKGVQSGADRGEEGKARLLELCEGLVQSRREEAIA
ncbi:hypothetical protein JCM6882_006693 [Rhodosporidiobolus microsporus]